MSISVDFSTKLIESLDQEIDIFKIKGIWKIGSEGNANSEIILKSFAEKLINRKKYLFLIDMLQLEYAFGDSIISFVVYCLKRQLNFMYVIVASGKTCENLENLFKNNGMKMNFLGFSDNVESGIEKLIEIEEKDF